MLGSGRWERPRFERSREYATGNTEPYMRRDVLRACRKTPAERHLLKLGTPVVLWAS